MFSYNNSNLVKKLRITLLIVNNQTVHNMLCQSLIKQTQFYIGVDVNFEIIE